MNIIKRVFWRYRGEQLLLNSFWPNDFRRGHEYSIDGRTYHITRYARAAAPSFFEVWGCDVAHAPAALPRQLRALGVARMLLSR